MAGHVHWYGAAQVLDKGVAHASVATGAAMWENAESGYHDDPPQCGF